MSQPPCCDENWISFEEAIARLLKLAKQHKSNLQAKNVLEQSKKWRENGKVEKEILDELAVDRQTQMKLAKILFWVRRDTAPNPESTLRARLTDHYYESIQPQLMAITTLHSRTILAQKVFDKISAENVVNLAEWMISKPGKHDALRQLNSAFDTSYWKARINRVRQSSYLFEQIEAGSQVDLLEFARQVVHHQNMMSAKFVEVVPCENVKLFINSKTDMQMIGHQNVLFNTRKNGEVSWHPENFQRHVMPYHAYDRSNPEYKKKPVFIGEMPYFSNPVDTGYYNKDDIRLFEPFLIKVGNEEE